MSKVRKVGEQTRCLQVVGSTTTNTQHHYHSQMYMLLLFLN